MNTYATSLYSGVNGAAPTNVVVTERTLLNNQDYSEWLTEKYTWKTEDSGDTSWPVDSGDDMVL